MQYRQGEFEGSRGARLFWQSWSGGDNPKGVLVLVHGFGEHSGRYRYFVERLSAAGIAVFAFDLRGHGKSEGRRGHISSMTDFRGDLSVFLGIVEAELPGVPRFIFGHSMGSLLVLDYVLRHPHGLAGTIISGAGMEPAGVATPAVVFLARVLAAIWPVFPLRLTVDAAGLTRDRAEIEAYENDPLIHNASTARMARELLDAIGWIKSHASDLQTPILMLHGEADRVNLPSGSRNFISRVTIPDKQLILYPGGFHELHNDLDRERELTDLVCWLREHIGSYPAEDLEENSYLFSKT
jgi:alpha-beta hydrolase superfamily lysophospholipase